MAGVFYYKGNHMWNTVIKWALQLGMSIITETLVKALLLAAAKEAAKSTKNKIVDATVKELEEHWDD